MESKLVKLHLERFAAIHPRESIDSIAMSWQLHPENEEKVIVQFDAKFNYPIESDSKEKIYVVRDRLVMSSKDDKSSFFGELRALEFMNAIKEFYGKDKVRLHYS